MKDDCVYYISEHRKSYNYNIELRDHKPKNPDVILFANSVTRFEVPKILEHFSKQRKIKLAILHIRQLKPFLISNKTIEYINSSKKGVLITDNDYADGLPRILAGKISEKTNKKCYILGLKNKTAGHHSKVDNLPPSYKDIIKLINTIYTN